MISARMTRPAKLLLVTSASMAAAASVAACGTQRITVPQSQGPVHNGAVLFNQRCAGCHTLSYAATHGSAANVRTAQYNNGPNFDQRCERPVTRVLYAIENGGFSGAVMPQNVVTGQNALDVAKFVATYSGHKAPKVPGVVPCQQEPIGTIPALTATGTTGATGTTAATAQAKQAGSQTSQSAGKAKGSTRKGGSNGKKPSTGTGQGQAPG